MTITRAELIAEAKTWKGTPWRHQGRLKGIASDCIGMIICAPRALGLFPPDFNITGYSRNPEPQVLIGYLKQYLDRIEPVSQMKGGDVLLLIPRKPRVPQHVAILTFEHTMIHAIDRWRGVQEHILDMRKYPVSSVWRYRGLADD